MKQPIRLALAAVLMLAAASLTAAAPDAPSIAPVPQNATEKAALDVMAKIGWGTNAATRELDEDLWHIINQANLGLIWSRPGLSLRDRELIVMAVLVAVGSPGISHLMEQADGVGITDAEMKELILQTIPYSGQPNAISAMVALKRVQSERKPKP
ncbi:MAG TPA: carboxymuconolactone decarboxylase family protein [Steroidobacteraceae bacterium]|nr:carboxymuconolactone decarboxylase family protein [Steroidobacteraceae bacterium]